MSWADNAACQGEDREPHAAKESTLLEPLGVNG